MRCAWQPEREAPCGPPKQSFGFFYYLYPIKFAMAEVGGVRKDSSSSPALPLARRYGQGANVNVKNKESVTIHLK